MMPVGMVKPSTKLMSYQSELMPAVRVNSANVSLPVCAHLSLPASPVHSERGQIRPDHLSGQPTTTASPDSSLSGTLFGKVLAGRAKFQIAYVQWFSMYSLRGNV